MTPSQTGSTAVDRIGRSDEQGPGTGREIAEVLADPDTEQAMQRGEDGDDRLAGRVPGRSVRRRDVAAGELRHGERPAHQAEALDQRRDDPDRDRQAGERRRRAEDHGEQDGQRHHREGAEQQRLPAQDQPGATGGEPSQDLVGVRRRMSG